jgi:nicotinamide-nucleotide amidase
MKHLLVEEVLPKLSTWHEDHALTTYQRIFRVFNLPENEVNRRIASLDLSPEVHIGYYPVFPEVHCSLTVRDAATNNARRLFNSSCKAITTVLGDAIYGCDRDSMAKIVGDQLRRKKLSLSVAESCTGGMICEKITAVPGSSDYLLGGIVSYANEIKASHLGVDPQQLETHGAVSRQVAEQMATGIRESCNADIGLAVTGIAGPGGGSDQKPVGTVYIGLATSGESWVTKFLFAGKRSQIREITTMSGLDLVRKYLLHGR